MWYNVYRVKGEIEQKINMKVIIENRYDNHKPCGIKSSLLTRSTPKALGVLI